MIDIYLLTIALLAGLVWEAANSRRKGEALRTTSRVLLVVIAGLFVAQSVAFALHSELLPKPYSTGKAP